MGANGLFGGRYRSDMLVVRMEAVNTVNTVYIQYEEGPLNDTHTCTYSHCNYYFRGRVSTLFRIVPRAHVHV